MKHKFLLTIIFLLTIGNMVYAQKVTLDFRQEKLGKVMEAISKQTGKSFSYSRPVINPDAKVSISVKDEELYTALARIIETDDVEIEITDKKIFLKPVQKRTPSTPTGGGQKQVTGHISDTSGEAVIGASVVLKGSSTGTVSDADGRFSISASAGSALVISYLGYMPQEIKVGDKSTLDIVLQEDVQSLDEVVVVGFGTQKKVNLTGAVGTVDAKDLQSRPVANVVQALQGLVPGLNIQQTAGQLNATPNVNIRGVGTIGSGSNSSVLVLIDGVEGTLAYVNPQDIENISVLKDAAASSIYGSRAPFGVILITTKKGKAGQIQVNYNNNFRRSTPTRIPKPMDSYTLATYMNDALLNSGSTPFVTDERLQRIKAYQNGTLKTQNVPDPNNPTLWAGGYEFGNANNNIYDIVYKDWAFSNEHNISASGGTERFNFYLSLGFLDQSGLLKITDDNYQKFTPMLKVEAQMTDWMKLLYSTRFVRTDYERPTYLDNGFFNNLERQGWAFVPTIDDNGHFGPTSALPLLVDGGRETQQNDHFYHHAAMVLEPVKNWITTLEFNYNTVAEKYHEAYLLTYTYDLFENPRLYTNRSWVTNELRYSNFMNINAFTSYKFTLNEWHNFSVMAGGQMENMKYGTFGGNREGVIVPELPVLDLTSGLDLNGTAVTPGVWGNSRAWSTAGYFGRFNYDYQGKYLLEANLRYDGTSRFREDKRWNWFSSFSAGWNIARERFWESLSDKVSILKLRGSYGELGNQNTSNWYPTYQVMSVTPNNGEWLQNGSKTNTAYSPALISSTLTWEKINTWNAGLDVAALNNRLTSSFEYYIRKTLNMVGPAMELPAILGKDVPRSNNTDLQTSGFELELAWKDRLKNDFSYGARFILSDYQTEITRYPNITKSLSTYYEGQKLGAIRGYETIGIAKSNEQMAEHLNNLPMGGQNAIGSQWAAGDIMYKDINGDGKIDPGSGTYNDPGDRRIIGNSTPRFQFGLDLNTAWKGFDFRVFFQGVGKRDYFSNSGSFWGSSGNMWGITGLQEHTDYFRLTASNDLPANIDSYYPRPLVEVNSVDPKKNRQTQTRYLQDASYIRLKNISLGYTLPTQVTQKFAVSNMRLYVSGENLWTGTKMATMFDPEAIDGVTGEWGLQYFLQKTVSFGISITL